MILVDADAVTAEMNLRLDPLAVGFTGRSGWR